CVFFFQAEDGIRDKLVTGVQTCALPICAPPSVSSPRRPLWRPWSRRPCEPSACHVGHRRRPCRGGRRAPASRNERPPARRRGDRSEERRVGKEGRSRSGGEHEKRKWKKK